jgi:hypothetical protein
VSARPRDLASSLTSPTAFTPVDPPSPVVQAGHAVPRDPGRLNTVEDAHEALRMAGAVGQRTEQLDGGQWLFACTAAGRVYEARGGDQLEAMRKVLAQLQK